MSRAAPFWDNGQGGLSRSDHTHWGNVCVACCLYVRPGRFVLPGCLSIICKFFAGRGLFWQGSHCVSLCDVAYVLLCPGSPVVCTSAGVNLFAGRSIDNLSFVCRQSWQGRQGVSLSDVAYVLLCRLLSVRPPGVNLSAGMSIHNLSVVRRQG